MKKSTIISIFLFVQLLNCSEKSEIHSCIMNGNTNEVRSYIEENCDLEARNSFGETLLSTACRCGNQEMVEMLLEKGAKINCRDSRDMTPLHLALGHYCERMPNSQNIIMKLLDCGADVNAKDERGETPLHFAIMHELDACVVEKMLTMGADVMAPNRHGKTAMRMATEEKMEDVLRAFRKCCNNAEIDQD